MWRKRKNKKEVVQNDLAKDKAATVIVKLVNGMQNKFGETLNKKTANFTQRQKIILLIIFCIAFGGGSIYIMVDGMKSPNSSSQLLNSKSIAVPKHVDKTGDVSPKIGVFISAEDIRKIKLFRRYMDSLKTSVKGKWTYDSIIRARPHLLDSVKEVEQLYKLNDSSTDFNIKTK